MSLIAHADLRVCLMTTILSVVVCLTPCVIAVATLLADLEATYVSAFWGYQSTAKLLVQYLQFQHR